MTHDPSFCTQPPVDITLRRSIPNITSSPDPTMDSGTVIEKLRTKHPSLYIVAKSHPDFDGLRLLYNHALVEEPLLIAQPQTEREVSAVVTVARDSALPLAIRSGGHDFWGRSLAHNGIILDMRRMDFVSVQSDKSSATVGGGILAGHLQQVLGGQGLFTPTGQVKSVGYVAWACGGGYGFYVGTYGFGVDQILGARVVLASGDLVDTEDDEELLWALRGAGPGNFGVVVELRIRVYPAPRLYAGFLSFPALETSAVMQKFKTLCFQDNIPDEFSGDSILSDSRMLQLPTSGPCFTFYWCWTAMHGDLRPAEAWLEKMRKLGTVLVDTIQESKSSPSLKPSVSPFLMMPRFDIQASTQRCLTSLL